MSGAEVLYSDVKFTTSKEKSTENASSSADTTYSEVRIAKTEPSTELPGPQQVVSNGGSKVNSQQVPLLILCVLLAAVVIALCYVCYDNIQTKAEKEALKRDITEVFSKMSCLSSCQTPKSKPSDSQPKWEGGWKNHSGKCYYFSVTYSSWNESRRLCRILGGDLVKIDSREEQVFLNQKLRDTMRCPEDKFWIGLTDSVEEDKWIWVDGSPLDTSLSFWFKVKLDKGQPGKVEPDNWNGTNPEGEDCARMGEKGGELDSWHDKSCKVPHRSICEKPTGRRQDVCV